MRGQRTSLSLPPLIGNLPKPCRASFWVPAVGYHHQVVLQPQLTKIPKGSMTAAQDMLVPHVALASPFPSGVEDWSPSAALPPCQTPAKQPATAVREREWAKVLGVSEQFCASPAVPSGTLTSLCTSWSSCMFQRGKSKGIISPQHCKREAVKQCSKWLWDSTVAVPRLVQHRSICRHWQCLSLTSLPWERTVDKGATTQFSFAVGSFYTAVTPERSALKPA